MLNIGDHVYLESTDVDSMLFYRMYKRKVPLVCPCKVSNLKELTITDKLSNNIYLCVFDNDKLTIISDKSIITTAEEVL